jgi:O-antigen/teichoic acid export membrane protein
VSQRLGKDVGWLWAGYVGRAFVYLGLVVVLTRSLGAAGFGALSLFLAVTLGVSQVAGSWPFLAVPVLSAHGRTIGAAFRPAAYVAGIATAGALVVALPISFLIHSRAPTSLASVVGYSVALVGLQGIYAVLQTEGRMSAIALVQTAERGAALVLALATTTILTLTVLGSEALLAIASIATCFAAYAWIGRRQGLFRGEAGDLPDHLISTVMQAVGAMGIVSVCSYGVAWVDVFILAAFKSNSDVGIYSLAYQVFTFVVQLGSLWAVAALPAHARSIAAGGTLSAQLPTGRILTGAAFWSAIVAAIAVGSAIVLPHAFGADFDAAYTPLMVLLAGSGIGAAGYFLVLPALIASGHAALIAKVSLVAVVINLTLDVLLVPGLGVLGPAIATVAQTLFATAVLCVFALGARPSLNVFAVGAPGAIGVTILAIDPSEPAFMVIAACAAILSAGLALGLTRRRVPLAASLGPES